MLKYIQSKSSGLSSMDTLQVAPDYINNHKISLNNHQIEVRFRYFSPKKHQQSNVSHNTNINDRASGSYYVNQSAKSSVVQNQVSITRQLISDKTCIDPKISSDKFYEEDMKEINHLQIQYFEQFQQKLLKKNQNKQQQKTIKLKLTHPKNNQAQKINKNLYIKRVQISLSNPVTQAKPISPRIQLNPSKKQLSNPSNRPSRIGNPANQKFVIKLYEDQKKNQNDGYTTPRERSGSKKKGITVYSSCSTKKNSIQDNVYVQTQNLCNLSVNNVSTNAVQRHSNTPSYGKKTMANKGPVRGSLRQRYDTQFVENLKIKAQLTKKRVYSKSRLTRKATPISVSASVSKKNR